jgi:hypothetical protein
MAKRVMKPVVTNQRVLGIFRWFEKTWNPHVLRGGLFGSVNVACSSKTKKSGAILMGQRFTIMYKDRIVTITQWA